MGAPLILGTCGLEAASGFVGLTAPGIPGELACGLPVVLGGADVPTVLWPGAGLAGATPGDSLLSRLPLFPVKLLPLLHPLLLLMPLPMSRLPNCLNHQRIAPSRKLRE